MAACEPVTSSGLRQGARVTFPMPVIKDTIQLTEEEQELFTALLDATKQVPALSVVLQPLACARRGGRITQPCSCRRRLG